MPVVELVGVGSPFSVSSTVANAGGTATATLPPLSGGTVWRVSQITVMGTSAANPAPACRVYINGLLITQTANGNGDAADGDPPLIVRSTDKLTVVWTGATPGDQFTANFFYDLATNQAFASSPGGGVNGAGGSVQRPTTPVIPW